MTFIPEIRDLYWTIRHIIQSTFWGVPSGGFVLTFNHKNFTFRTYTVMNPSDKEAGFFLGVFTNLLILGYKEEERTICTDVTNTEQIMKYIFRYTDDEIEIAKIQGSLHAPDDPRFNKSD